MFEQLDDLRPRPKATAKLLITASACVLMLGIMIGILTGRRSWEFWPGVTLWGAVFCRLLFPIYRPLADDLKYTNGH